MKNLDLIAEELFNKIRGRFPKVTLGDDTSTITNEPNKARFFNFNFTTGSNVNITVDEDSLTVMYNNDLLNDAEQSTKESWYGFMKELRQFAKKRMLNFDTRDITKTNLDKRDYQYLSTNRPGDEQMSESKMYGTSRTSFQDVGEARLVVKHRGPVDQEAPAGRTQRIDSIYIESAEGERFKYPYRHLNGARAMAMHVSEGGNAYDSFGKHIVSLSEELSKLRQFKTYMNRSSVMAEGLAGYMDIVNERIDTVKETIFKLQKQGYYKEAFESFEETVMEEVPEDVSSTWIDELTIRQFNEDLKSVFPYIYNLVKEGMKSKVVGPEDLLGETEESYSPGDEYEEGMVSNCCGASIQDVYDGFGRCSECGEMAEAVPEEEESYNMEDEYASHLDNVVANSKHEQGPDIEEGNDFVQKVQALKAKGAKPGTKFKTSDGKEHTLEDAITLAGMSVNDFWTAEELEEFDSEGDDAMDVKIGPDGSIAKADSQEEKEEELPLDEFIKGHFDYTTNQFPKGETAVLTAVEKKYGDDKIRDAAMYMKELSNGNNKEMERIRKLAGIPETGQNSTSGASNTTSTTSTKPKTGFSLTGKMGKDGKLKVTKSTSTSTKSNSTAKPTTLNVKM